MDPELIDELIGFVNDRETVCRILDIAHALEHLKAIEGAPRVLEINEVGSLSRGVPVIVEQRQAGWEHLLIARDLTLGLKFTSASARQFILHWNEYGITWRVWSRRPTKEQREAVPWNE